MSVSLKMDGGLAPIQDYLSKFMKRGQSTPVMGKNVMYYHGFHVHHWQWKSKPDFIWHFPTLLFWSLRLTIFQQMHFFQEFDKPFFEMSGFVKEECSTNNKFLLLFYILARLRDKHIRTKADQCPKKSCITILTFIEVISPQLFPWITM